MRSKRTVRRRIAAVVATLTLAVPAVAATAATAAADPPTEIPAGRSVYTTMPTDPTAVVLGSAEFPVHGGGVGDDTAAIQAAIDEASRRGGENWLGNIVGGARGVEVGDGGGLVFVPEGTYRVTDRIDVHASVRLIGFGESRPEFYVPPSTVAFAGDPEFVFAAVRRPWSENGTITFGNNDTFGTGLVNVDITVDEGNPGAVGVRFGGAQMFLLQDVDIDMGDGYAGIDHNANLIQRVNVRGGQFGLLAFAASPGWQTTIIDSSFTGQAESGIRLHTDAKLSIIRTRFTDLPRGIEATPAQTQRLYVQDSLFEGIDGPVITLNDSESVPATDEPDLVRAQNQLNIVSTGVVDSGPLLRTQPSGSTWTVPEDSYLVNDATLGLRVADALTDGEQRTDAVVVDAQARPAPAMRSLLASDIPLPPDSGSWVNIAEYAAERGVTIGTGTEDDHAIFQQALTEHNTVYVPMGEYLLTDTLELRRENNLVALHPRQTWLTIPDESAAFGDPEAPRSILHTPHGGQNFVAGLGLDTAVTNPGSVHVHWQSGAESHLSDIATQFVKWAPDETAPGDPALGDPGYDFRGDYKYNFWIDGGGGSFVNLWAVAGWAENGFLVENTSVPGRVYEISVEHHRHREVVMRNVRGWELHALQTEDHIYGWESQAVELDGVRDVLFGNTVFFRVATVLGPYPYAVGVTDSRDVVIRGTRGYRPTNVANTRWGATVRDVETGREVPELEVAYLGIDVPGRDVRATGISLTGDASLNVLPDGSTTTELVLTNHQPGPLADVEVTVSSPDGLGVRTEAPGRIDGKQSVTVPLTVAAPADADHGTTHDLSVSVSFAHRGRTMTVERGLTVRVGGENLAVGADVTASSVLSSNVAANAVDGQTTGARWISGTGDPLPTLTIDLGEPADLLRAVVHSGVTGSDALRVRSFAVDGLTDGTWHTLGQVEANAASPVAVPLTDALGVSSLRLRFTEPSPSDGLARVFEVQIFGTR
ncbi:glycosyl hydrolase family 28-related protein [Georgenia subflava]|uniref:F5/8 type C domain-containing protein n=1 Tax=Georgenia subflava TaxID=1622177 RepID=A0A6N7EBW1_9MICO|nr:glycosyl hydrolase family 28-related protein [Georgenia subflava]MPV35460.1 hypothetical protein [Georgenia subflava]